MLMCICGCVTQSHVGSQVAVLVCVCGKTVELRSLRVYLMDMSGCGSNL